MAQNTSSQMAAPTDDSLQQQLSKANDFASKGELTQATDLYVQMLGLAQKQRDSVSQNTILLRLGELYYAQKKYEQAEVQLQQALKLSQQLGGFSPKQALIQAFEHQNRAKLGTYSSSLVSHLSPQLSKD